MTTVYCGATFGGTLGRLLPLFGAILTGGSTIAFKKLGYTGSFKSYSEAIQFANDAWNKAMGGSLDENYLKALDFVNGALKLPVTDLLYFSHPKNSGRFQWVKDTVSLRINEDPNFVAIVIGPFDSKGEQVLFIASNDPGCGFYSTCGPPWPR